jgi:hypothetical protein
VKQTIKNISEEHKQDLEFAKKKKKRNMSLEKHLHRLALPFKPSTEAIKVLKFKVVCASVMRKSHFAKATVRDNGALLETTVWFFMLHFAGR